MKNSKHTWLSAIGLTLLCAACSGQGTRILSYDTRSAEPARVELSNVQIEIASGLKDRFSSITVSDSESTHLVTQFNLDLIPEDEITLEPGCRIWLAGKRLELNGDQLEIGGFGFGTVRPGDSVLVDTDGVHVDGQLRGHLPD